MKSAATDFVSSFEKASFLLWDRDETRGKKAN